MRQVAKILDGLSYFIEDNTIVDTCPKGLDIAWHVRASKQLYLDSIPACDQHYHLGRSLIHGNAGLLALSAWTSRSTEGQMEGLSHASSRWWYDRV